MNTKPTNIVIHNAGSSQDFHDSLGGGIGSHDSLQEQNDLKILKAQSVNQKYMTELIQDNYKFQ